jgi:methylenetetrahydrofolate/methylenetetrahydromethanopterin dehydrogenase (NADP+)
MSKPRILIQLDPDAHSSVFDAVVAVDSGVDHLLQYANVQPDQVRDLVHGAIFTRGPKDLHQTAVFIGGTDVTAGERLLEEVTRVFFGPMRVSVLLDASGANTTAAAAVLAAARHVPLDGATALVLAATGPVGQRAVRLLAREGAEVRVASRSADRAATVCQRIAANIPSARLQPLAAGDSESVRQALQGVSIVIAAGAAGVELIPAALLEQAQQLQVAVDLNAVPPLGIGGIGVGDQGVLHSGVSCYGAIGVGNTKMKIHRAAIAQLFASNDQVLDAEEIFQIGRQLTSESAVQQTGSKEKDVQLATFGAGCFWCVEAVFQQLNGVVSVRSGYMGGDVDDPTYEQVCRGDTGHAEVCQIQFDPAVISYDDLLEVFWKTHDPTTLNRQGADVGTQYRSVIFYHDDHQKELAENRKRQLDQAGLWPDSIVTEISPAERFYPAEEYHQNYYRDNAAKGYCQAVIRPKLDKFRQVFGDRLID